MYKAIYERVTVDKISNQVDKALSPLCTLCVLTQFPLCTHSSQDGWKFAHMSHSVPSSFWIVCSSCWTPPVQTQRSCGLKILKLGHKSGLFAVLSLGVTQLGCQTLQYHQLLPNFGI